MPAAEIITIGTEILLGEIVDTNAASIAQLLRLEGVDVYRKTSVGDNVERIAQVIREALERCDIIITTGGLGPTVDDPTREAVALALGRNLEYHPQLWEQIQERFRRYNRMPSENNRKQAYLPQGSIPIENAVGTAPCFAVYLKDKTIVSLPGVPKEMEYIMHKEVLPLLRQRHPSNAVLKMRILHTIAVGESQLDALIGEYEKNINPTVGLAAHSGQTDVRIVAKAHTYKEAEELIDPLEKVLMEQLGQWVYGKDDETLEAVIREQLKQKKMKIVLLECGLGGALVSKLSVPLWEQKEKAGSAYEVFLGGECYSSPMEKELLTQTLGAYQVQKGAEIGLGVSLQPDEQRMLADLVLITTQGRQYLQRSYGGPRKNGSLWATHQALYLLWQYLKKPA